MSVSMNYTLIVTGSPRSGTTLMMRMLNAGGIDCLVEEKLIQPGDKHTANGVWELVNAGPRIKGSKPDFTTSRAVKLLAPFITWWPLDRDTKAIFMLRRLADINASLLAMGKVWDLTPGEMVQMAREYIQDHGLSVHYIQYDDLIKYPKTTSFGIAQYLELDLDIESMGKLVIDTKEGRKGSEIDVVKCENMNFLSGGSPDVIE